MKKSCFTMSLSVALLFSAFAYSQSSGMTPRNTATQSDSTQSDSAAVDSTTNSIFGWDGMDGSDPPATFEIGVLIGEPMAISAKYWFNKRVAVDAGAGWSFSDNGKLDILGDILLHPYYIPLDIGDLPTYIGAGAAFRIGDGDSFLGVRFPIGAEFLLSGFPITLSGEIVPVMEVIPDMGFRLEGGVAIRFAFGRQ